MLTIDAHQHFWKYHPDRHAWIDDAMKVIRQNFMPEELQPILQENNIDGCVSVQADQTEAETDFLTALAKDNTFIKGIVGWVDLKAANIVDRLAHYNQFSIIKGFRHIMQGQAEGFMLQHDFLNGIRALKEFGYTYDILIYADQLQEAIELVKKNPDQLFVIDHLAKPTIKAGLIDNWRRDMQTIAKYENVYCKLSGMVTEADYENWKPDELTPYLEVVTNAFGTNKIMFGSDWPVCLVAASYKRTIDVVKDYFKTFSKEEQEKIFGQNAIRFYQLK